MIRTKNVRNSTKFKRSVKAISPVIATLLMIAIAVVASLVAYAWVMGYMNFTTEKSGKAIQIQSVSYNPTDSVFTIYVQNVGDADIEFPDDGTAANIFINGAVAQAISGNPADFLKKGETATLTGTASSLDSGVQSVTIKVTTSDGTFSQLTKQFTIGSSGPTPTPTAPPGGNTAPVLAAIGARSVNELATLTFTISATDSDVPAQTLTYSATGLPTGATFTPATRVFSWTPTATQGSVTPYQITFRVTDNGVGALYDEETVAVTVNDGAGPQVVTNSPTTDSDSGWDNEDRAYVDGGGSSGYGTSNNNGEWIIYSNYVFSIPLGATNIQVRVRLDAWHSNPWYGGDDDIRLEVNDGSWHTYSPNPIQLTGSETTIWCDVTSLSSGGWNPTEVNGIQARVTHVESGWTDDIYLDWIPIEVTYTP